MGRKPSNVVTAEVNHLRKILENPENYNKLDPQIMQEVGIKPATFYRYKQKIREQDIEAWREIAKETQEQSLLKIKRALDYANTIYKDVIDHAPDHRAKIVAAQQIIQNAVWAKQLLDKSPKQLPVIEAKIIEQAEEQAIQPIRNTTV